MCYAPPEGLAIEEILTWIKTVDLNKSFQVYIGAQATGKSTVCKTVYFCEKLRDFSLSFLLEEAHLFPVAQRYIVQFISLIVNSTSGSVLITTHSPYILTSANILLYSYQVEKEEGKVIVPKELRIPGEIFEAYKVVSETGRGSRAESIFDREEALIDTAYIDEVSGITNRELNQLIANDMQ